MNTIEDVLKEYRPEARLIDISKDKTAAAMLYLHLTGKGYIPLLKKAARYADMCTGNRELIIYFHAYGFYYVLHDDNYTQLSESCWSPQTLLVMLKHGDPNTGLCPICEESNINDEVAFNSCTVCGQSTCYDCIKKMDLKCPFCRSQEEKDEEHTVGRFLEKRRAIIALARALGDEVPGL